MRTRAVLLGCVDQTATANAVHATSRRRSECERRDEAVHAPGARPRVLCRCVRREDPGG